MTNPIYKEILKGFVEHLERRDSSNGWQIISKPSYDNKSTYTKSSPMQSNENVLGMVWDGFRWTRVWDRKFFKKMGDYKKWIN